MTYRAVRILGEVDLVAAEDTRHSLKLLNHFNISKPLTSYFDHNQQFKGERILDALRQGRSRGPDLGCRYPLHLGPGLQPGAGCRGRRDNGDPASRALRRSRCALRFRPAQRQLHLCRFSRRHGRASGAPSWPAWSRLPGTLVLYEAPHRLEETLRDIRAVMGERQTVVARELSKIYEEFMRGPVSEVIAAAADGKARGEIVILMAAGEAVEEPAEPLESVAAAFTGRGGAFREGRRPKSSRNYRDFQERGLLPRRCG